MRLVPIEIDSPQDKLAKATASLLMKNGVPDTLALPLAIQIMSAMSAATDDYPDLALERLRDWNAIRKER